jgi:hypothetical protein
LNGYAFPAISKQQNVVCKLTENQHLKNMCEKCFDKEIFRFESQSDFNDFEKTLEQKSKYLELINSKHEYLDDYHYTYTCRNCNKNWWLSIPENAWRGYFLTEKKAEDHIKNIRSSDKKKKNGCLILIAIFFIILMLSLINSCVGKSQKFDKIKWNEREDGFYLYREEMIGDLTENYLKKGTTYKNIISLLGAPQNLNDEIERTISYELMTDYGWDIDPVEVKTLKIKISKDSTLNSFKIEHWKKQ